jgi:hypothetical protein
MKPEKGTQEWGVTGGGNVRNLGLKTVLSIILRILGFCSNFVGITE